MTKVKVLYVAITTILLAGCVANSITPFWVGVVDHWYVGEERPVKELALLRQYVNPTQRAYGKKILLRSNGIVTTRSHVAFDAYLLPGEQVITLAANYNGEEVLSKSVIRFTAQAGHTYEARIATFRWEKRSLMGPVADWEAEIVDLTTNEVFKP